MLDASVLLPFVAAVVVIALTPGPDMTFFLGRALSSGRAAGLAAVAGAGTGLLVHTLLVALGVSALIVAAPAAFAALKIAGALYLLWLAFQAIRHGSALRLPSHAAPRSGLLGTWASGVAINVLNPKVALFFLTFLPQFVSATDPHAAAKLFLLGSIFILLGSAINLAIVLAADRFATGMRANPRVARALDWLFASIFAAFAARLLFARAH
ncbi:LysE family translocator [Amaricoccus solimangrovi]|uniref:LysE family translocator n=1 Tax=Amaricoccus solimangrovi TaxID=2589815 RepID=A0A501X0Y9_9RHOB|nr:LysE family translocator [Amaricoccus solimangrovi]TPE53811.1 LysE family translocator [Amaricoccus solimangrovi]